MFSNGKEIEVSWIYGYGLVIGIGIRDEAEEREAVVLVIAPYVDVDVEWIAGPVVAGSGWPPLFRIAGVNVGVAGRRTATDRGGR